MLIIWRAWYFVGIVGLALAVHGVPETALALHVNAEPADVDVDGLASGAVLERPYVRVGPHVDLIEAGSTYDKKRSLKTSFAYPIAAAGKPSQPPYSVFVLVDNQSTARRGASTELVGIARRFGELGARERAVITRLARGSKPESLVAIEKDHHPRLLISLLECGGAAALLAWAVSLFLEGRKPKAAEENGPQGA